MSHFVRCCSSVRDVGGDVRISKMWDRCVIAVSPVLSVYADDDGDGAIGVTPPEYKRLHLVSRIACARK